MSEVAFDDIGLPRPSDRDAAWFHGTETAARAWHDALRRWALREPGADPAAEISRHGLDAHYGETVPTRRLLGALSELGPLAVFGAGREYWSRLLNDLGRDAVACETPDEAGAPHAGRAVLLSEPSVPARDVVDLLKRGAPPAVARCEPPEPTPSDPVGALLRKERWQLTEEIMPVHRWNGPDLRLAIWRPTA